MKLLVLGGTHGNETLGVDLVKLLKRKPLAGVDALIANPRAVAAGTRCTETDLNRSFGVQNPVSYEEKRALELQKICDTYDLVLDLHNTQTPDNDCSFVGIGCNPALFDVSAKLGLRRCIEATYDCVNKFCPNVLSLELSFDGAFDNAQFWHEKIAQLIAGELEPLPRVDVYRFFGRVTWEEREKLHGADWKPFEEIPKAHAQTLATGRRVVPIFMGSHLTEFYATLLTPVRDIRYTSEA